MKLEKTTFTAAYAVTTVLLNDSTLIPTRFIFWIDGANSSHGTDDGIIQVSTYNSGTLTKNDRSIYLHNGSTALMSGRVTNIDPLGGEFDVTFDVRTGTTINCIAIEE